METSPYSHSYSRLSSDRTTEARSTVCWNSEPSRRPEPRLAAANLPANCPAFPNRANRGLKRRDGLRASLAQDRQVLARADRLKEAARRCGPLLSLRSSRVSPALPGCFRLRRPGPGGLIPGAASSNRCQVQVIFTPARKSPWVVLVRDEPHRRLADDGAGVQPVAVGGDLRVVDRLLDRRFGRRATAAATVERAGRPDPCQDNSLRFARSCHETFLHAVSAARRRAFPKRLVDLVLEALEPRQLRMLLLSEHGFELLELVTVEFDVLADFRPVGVTTCLRADLPRCRLSSKRGAVAEQLR